MKRNFDLRFIDRSIVKLTNHLTMGILLDAGVVWN